MDNATYAIERARLKSLIKLRDNAKLSGETTRYADLVAEVASSERRIQRLLAARG